MAANKNDHVYIIAHIPKTAGSSLRAHFANHLTVHETLIHLDGSSYRDAKTKGLAPFEDRPLVQREKAKVILGHDACYHTATLVPGLTPRFVVFLRDPAEQIVSHYNYRMEHLRPPDTPVTDFETWYKQWGTNPQTNWMIRRFLGKQGSLQMSADQVFTLMDQLLTIFHLVGDSKRLAETAKPLLAELGIPNNIPRCNQSGKDYPRRQILTAELHARLHDENEIDLALYKKWCGTPLATAMA